MSMVITLSSGRHWDRQLTLGCPSKCGNQYHSILPTPSFKIEKINEPMIMILKVVSDQITVLRGSWCVKCEMEQHTAAQGRQRIAARCTAACQAGPGPPTTQLINRQRVEPERAGLAAPLPAVPSGLLGLGWCPQRLGQWD